MDLVCRNKEIVITSEIEEFEEVQLDYRELVFNEFLKQLKIKSHSEIEGSIHFIPANDNYIQLDEFLFNSIDFKQIIRPEMLVRYALLLIYLDLEFSYGNMNIVVDKKLKPRYSLQSIKEIHPNSEFKLNALIHELKSKLSAKIIKSETDHFFALTTIRLKDKLIQSLSNFQISTGIEVNKSEIANNLLNVQRLSRFRDFLNINFN